MEPCLGLASCHLSQVHLRVLTCSQLHHAQVSGSEAQRPSRRAVSPGTSDWVGDKWTSSGPDSCIWAGGGWLGSSIQRVSMGGKGWRVMREQSLSCPDMPEGTPGNSLRNRPGNPFLPHPEDSIPSPRPQSSPLGSSLPVHASGHSLGMGKETEALEDVQGARKGMVAAGKEAGPMSWPLHRPKGPLSTSRLGRASGLHSAGPSAAQLRSPPAHLRTKRQTDGQTAAA